jgi:hypothetical protein
MIVPQIPCRVRAEAIAAALGAACSSNWTVIFHRCKFTFQFGGV